MDSELLTLVRKALGPGGRLESLEARMNTIAQTKGDTADAIRKVFMSGGGGKSSMIHGWDGASETQLTQLASGKHTKSIGEARGLQFGDWLSTVAAGCLPNVKGIGRPLDKVEKAMKDFGSRQVTKAPNAEGSGATGGYLVPPQYYAKLLQILAEKSFVKALCTTMPMNGREFWFPFLNQQTTVPSAALNYPASNFYGGVFMSWEPEAALYPQTNPGFKLGRLVARDLVAISVASNQLLQDSAIALDSLFTSLFSEALSWQLDYAFLRGTGVNQPLGIINAPGTVIVARNGAGLFTLANAASMFSHLAMTSWTTSCWIFNQSVLPQLIQMTQGATNAPFLVWANPTGPGEDGPAARKLPVTFFGLPIYWTEKTPLLGTVGDAMIVDLSKYLCGDRMAIQVEASQFPFFTSNQMVWRVIWRGDGQPQLDGPITLADGSQTFTVSPHVILSA